MMDEEINNEVKIASKDIVIYLGECILRFQSRDQLTLSSENKDKAKKILCFLNPLGIIADRDFSDGDVDYRNMLKGLMGAEEMDEEIKIADRDIRIYLGSVAMGMFYRDKLILSAGQGFVEKMRYVANILNALGVVIDGEWKKENGKIALSEKEVEVLNNYTGRKETKVFYKLGITKIPETCLDSIAIKNKPGKLCFKEDECEVENKKTGRREVRKFYKLGLTKIPEIYMYTDPDKAVEYPELED